MVDHTRNYNFWATGVISKLLAKVLHKLCVDTYKGELEHELNVTICMFTQHAYVV